MLIQNQAHILDRQWVVISLTTLRQEWEAAVEGESLMETMGVVGLMLGDICMFLGLSSREQKAVLGDELCRDFIQVMKNGSK